MKGKNKIFILYNFPTKEHWLAESLSERFGKENVSVIKIKRRVHDSASGGRLNTLRSAPVLALQCLKTLFKSKRNDVIVCWNPKYATVLNFISLLLFKKRRIIGLHWLSPKSKGLRRSLERSFAKRSRNSLVVNAEANVNAWKTHLSLKNAENIYYLPDSYGKAEFYDYKLKPERYCFAGGMNDRDWTLLAETAAKLKDVKFVCVALEKHFKSQVNNVPQNLKVYFNLPEDEYYSLMQNAYLSVVMLKRGDAAGLINLIKSAAYCIPCVSTFTSATEKYYDGDYLTVKNPDEWAHKISDIFALNERDYKALCIKYRDFIKQKFSPEHTADVIAEAVRRTDLKGRTK